MLFLSRIWVVIVTYWNCGFATLTTVSNEECSDKEIETKKWERGMFWKRNRNLIVREKGGIHISDHIIYSLIRRMRVSF